MGLSGAGASILFLCFFGAGGCFIGGSSIIALVVSGSATAVVSVGVSDTGLWGIRPVDVVAEHDGNVLVGGSGGAEVAKGVRAFGAVSLVKRFIAQAMEFTGGPTVDGSSGSSWTRVVVAC